MTLFVAVRGRAGRGSSGCTPARLRLSNRLWAPTIVYPNLPSGWNLGSSASSARRSATDALSPIASLPSPWRASHGCRPEHLGSMDGGSWDAADRPERDLGRAVGPQRRAEGRGTAQLTAATDQQTLFAQNTPLSVWFGVRRRSRPSEPSIVAAQWFEIRFTCLDQCSTDLRPCAVLRTSLAAQFDVGRRIAARRRSDRQRDGRPDVVGADALRSERCGRGRQACSERWSRSMARMRWRMPIGGAATLPRHRSGSERQRVRRRPAVPAADRRRIARRRHCRSCRRVSTVVRILLEDAAGNRTAIFGPLTRDDRCTSGRSGPGSDPALRGAANGDGAERPGAADRALGPAGESDACS